MVVAITEQAINRGALVLISYDLSAFPESLAYIKRALGPRATF